MAFKKNLSYFIATIIIASAAIFMSSCGWFGMNNEDDFVCDINHPTKIPLKGNDLRQAINNNKGGMCANNRYRQHIHYLWEKRKPVYEQWIKSSTTTPYSLYQLQGETHNLFKYSQYCNDEKISNALLTLYLKAVNTLDTTDQYTFYYYPNSTSKQSVQKLDKPYVMWLDKNKVESILASSQYLALMAEVLNTLTTTEEIQKTALMQDFIKAYIPVLKDHYTRWLFSDIGPFQVKGWGCKVNNKNVATGLNHHNLLQKKQQRQLGDHHSPSYCNAVTDVDLWLITGVSHLMAASQKGTTQNILTNDEYAVWDTYLNSAITLLASRISESNLQNWQNETVQGANFDLGVWRDLSSHHYAGVTEIIHHINALDVAHKKASQTVGWDLSHARRFVHAFDSLHNNKALLKKDFPSDTLMTKFANQLLYGVFNQDLTLPLFSNYMDGSNGWYRVNYAGKKGFGYMPWDMSITAITGGYGFWSAHNADMITLYAALIDMFNSDNAEVQQHVKQHYVQNVWVNYQRDNKQNFTCVNEANYYAKLIQFLPSLSSPNPTQQK